MSIRPLALVMVLASGLTCAACTNDDRTVLGQQAGPCDPVIREFERDLDERADELNAFVEESASTGPALRRIDRAIREIEGVLETGIVTKAEAYERASRLFEDTPDVMEGLPGNPFPASIEVRADRDDVELVASAIESIDGIDDVVPYGRRAREIVDRYWTGDLPSEKTAVICEMAADPATTIEDVSGLTELV